MIYWPASCARSVQLDKPKYSRDGVNHLTHLGGSRPICYGGQSHFDTNRDTLSCHWPLPPWVKGRRRAFSCVYAFAELLWACCLMPPERLGLFLFYIWLPAGPSRRSHRGGQDKTLQGGNLTVPLKWVSVQYYLLSHSVPLRQQQT